MDDREYLDKLQSVTVDSMQQIQPGIFSSSYIVNSEYVAKIVKPRHRILHNYITKGKNAILPTNLFKSYASVQQMVNCEYTVLEKLRNNNISAPKPIEKQHLTDCSILLIEYLADNQLFIKSNITETTIRDLIYSVNKMHSAQIAHGDIKSDNILVKQDGGIALIDPTKVDTETEEYRYYDLACTAYTVYTVDNDSLQLFINQLSSTEKTQVMKYLRKIILFRSYNTTVGLSLLRDIENEKI